MPEIPRAAQELYLQTIFSSSTTAEQLGVDMTDVGEVTPEEVLVGAFVHVLKADHESLAAKEEALLAVRQHATDKLQLGQTVVRVTFWEAQSRLRREARQTT